MDKFDWAIQFVLKHEGGFSDHPDDPGNYRPDGTLVGTKYGISARSYPGLDIPNLTIEQAKNIYQLDYWTPLGCEQLPPREALALLDFGVNAGVGRAKRFWQETGNFHDFIAKRLRFYVKLEKFSVFGKGWVNRVADLIDYVSDPKPGLDGVIDAKRAYICIRKGLCFPVPFSAARVVGDKLFLRMTGPPVE